MFLCINRTVGPPKRLMLCSCYARLPRQPNGQAPRILLEQCRALSTQVLYMSVDPSCKFRRT